MTIAPLVLMAFAGVLSTGDRMALLEGQYLSGRPAKLPDDASGKIALVALGFTYSSRFAVEAWTGKFRKDFGERPAVTFYEVPMIGGMARLGKWFIDSGMRKGTPPGDYEHVVTQYGGGGPWKQWVGYDKPDAAYLILLDRNGRVRWRYQGGFDENAYQGLSTAMTELLAAS